MSRNVIECYRYQPTAYGPHWLSLPLLGLTGHSISLSSHYGVHRAVSRQTWIPMAKPACAIEFHKRLLPYNNKSTRRLVMLAGPQVPGHSYTDFRGLWLHPKTLTGILICFSLVTHKKALVQSLPLELHRIFTNLQRTTYPI